MSLPLLLGGKCDKLFRFIGERVRKYRQKFTTSHPKTMMANQGTRTSLVELTEPLLASQYGKIELYVNNSLIIQTSNKALI